MMALSKNETLKTKQRKNHPKPKTPQTNREILSSNLKKVLENIEMQDQKELATLEEKRNRSKIDFEFQ